MTTTITTSPVCTTFVVLQSRNGPPAISNSSSPAGEAFNQTLRKIASLDGFHSELFGWLHNDPASELLPSAGTDITKEGEMVWDAHYMGWRRPGDSSTVDGKASEDKPTLIWVINWNLQATSDVHAEILGLLQHMMSYFEIPASAGTSFKELSSSVIFSVSWHDETKSGINRILHSGEVFLYETQRKQFSDVKSNSGTATGSVLNLTPNDREVSNVRLRSAKHTSEDMENASTPETDIERLIFKTILTRTRWCTKIKQDMLSSINARRVD